MTPKRMPKAQRRAQLMDMASAIVRSEGTDALTLATLADRAGVTKPIAYGHIGTRAGLLMALYRHYDLRQVEAVRLVLETRARTLDDAAAILAAAHVDCVLSSGPEFAAVAAALAATEGFRQALRETYVAQYREALGPFADASVRLSNAVFVGLLGAADALAQDAAVGRLPRSEVVDALTRIIVGALVRAATESVGPG